MVTLLIEGAVIKSGARVEFTGSYTADNFKELRKLAKVYTISIVAYPEYTDSIVTVSPLLPILHKGFGSYAKNPAAVDNSKITFHPNGDVTQSGKKIKFIDYKYGAGVTSPKSGDANILMASDLTLNLREV